MKKTFNIFEKKVNEGDGEKQAKQLVEKISSEIRLLFFRKFFYLPKLTVFFGNRQQSNAR